MSDEERSIECSECESPVQFVEDDGSLLLTCGCADRGIDVTEAVGANSLFDPLTGLWSYLDHDSKVYNYDE